MAKGKHIKSQRKSCFRRFERVALLQKESELWSSQTINMGKMGLENLLMKTEGSTLFYFCVSLWSSLKNLMLLLLQRAVKINYLTYTKYYECAPCNFLINQNVSSFNLGQCTVFRGY